MVIANVGAEEIETIVRTNVLGTLLVAREAMRRKCNHFVLVGGAGTRRAMATPKHLVRHLHLIW